MIKRAQKRVTKGNEGEFDKIIIEHANDDDDTLHAWATEFFEEQCDEQGNWLTTYNPESRYDYFGEIDEMTMAEWLETGDKTSEEDLRAEWQSLSQDGDGFWKSEYYIETYGDEKYIR